MVIAVFQALRSLQSPVLSTSKVIPIPALAVPEIVQGIIHQLSPHKRKTIARLVCKQWYRIACSLTPETLTWRVPLDEASCHVFSLKLARTQVLTFVCEPEPEQVDEPSAPNTTPPEPPQSESTTTKATAAMTNNTLSWTAIQDLIKTAHAEGRLNRVRELRVVGLPVSSLLPFFPHISVLRIYKCRTDTVELKLIWENCPSLLELYLIRSRNDTGPKIIVSVLQRPNPQPPYTSSAATATASSAEDSASTNPNEDNSPTETTITSSLAPSAPPVQSPLKSNKFDDPNVEDMAFLDLNLQTLVVYDLVLTIEVFRSILRACPRLKTLQIIRAHTKRIIDTPPDQEKLESERADAQSIRLACYQLLRTSHPTIQEFQLSTYRAPISELDVKALSTLGDNNNENRVDSYRRRWSFLDQDISMSLLRGLRPLIRMDRNLLTELEFWPSFPGPVNSGEFLHEIMCSCPSLLHVRAPQVTLSSHLLDVNDVMDYHDRLRRHDRSREEEHLRIMGLFIPSEDRQDSETNPSLIKARKDLPSRVWVCRNLKTLHVWLKGSDAENNLSYAGVVIFGYLSRVCPRIQELHIRRDVLGLELTNGLFLLGRLQELERLKITARITDTGVTAGGMEWLRKKPATMTPYKLMWAWVKEFTRTNVLFVGPDSLCGTNVLDEKGENRVEWLKEMPKIPSSRSILRQKFDSQAEREGEEAGHDGDDEEEEAEVPYPDLTLLGRGDNLISFIEDTETLRFPMLASFEIECWRTRDPNAKEKFESQGRRVRPEVRFEMNEVNNIRSLLDEWN
ncbi:hypothetical protein BGZ83_001478 [Gryganskiella cystojenkinii]|nr:hypothetical protein BGZ83_001478 [Gryganskiella cystojenkinii]